ncbi:MAG: HNH endonuclease signature motif containing protein, partial [Pseudobdellovibrionaceae bacterium]
SSKKKRAVSLEESLNLMVDLYLEKYDPIKRAKRQKMRGKLQEEGNSKTKASTRRREDAQFEIANALKDKTKAVDIQKESVRAKTINDFTAPKSNVIGHRGRVENVNFKTMSNGDGEANVKKPSTEAEGNSTVSHNLQGPSIVAKMRASKIRKPLKTSLKHSVQLKYNSRCAHTDSSGKRCSQRRHLDVHHIIQASQGGGDELENLTLLCSGHHKMIHSLRSSE